MFEDFFIVYTKVSKELCIAYFSFLREIKQQTKRCTRKPAFQKFAQRLIYIECLKKDVENYPPAMGALHETAVYPCCLNLK